MKFRIPEVFKRKSVGDKILKAKINQRKADETYWTLKLSTLEANLKNDYSLELYEKECQIKFLQEQIDSDEKRNKKLNAKEYDLKIQTKETAFMANNLSGKLDEFGDSVAKIVGEFRGLKEELETHQKKIEKK